MCFISGIVFAIHWADSDFNGDTKRTMFEYINFAKVLLLNPHIDGGTFLIRKWKKDEIRGGGRQWTQFRMGHFQDISFFS